MLTVIQLKRQKEKILSRVAQIKHRLEGLQKLRAYHLHCLEGYEKGYQEEIEHELTVRPRVAKAKHAKEIEVINHKLEECAQERRLLLYKMEGLEKGMEACLLQPTTRKGKGMGRPRKEDFTGG